MIFLTHSLRLHDFFVCGGCVIFFVERFGNFFVERLHDFFGGEVA